MIEKKDKQPVNSKVIDFETLEFIAPMDIDSHETEEKIDFMINEYCPSSINDLGLKL